MQQSIDKQMMHLALEEARKAFRADEVPVGAVLIDSKGKVIAADCNGQEHLHDITAHAEMKVIKTAQSKLVCTYLENLTLYVTLEPCPMCAGAILLSRIGRLVFGASDVRMGAVESLFAVLTHPSLHRKLQIRGGVLEDECKAILQQFFITKR